MPSSSTPAPTAFFPDPETMQILFTREQIAGMLERMIARARKAPYIAVDTETVIEPGSPQKVDPLRSILVAISIAVGSGEAFYLPLRHRVHHPEQGDLQLGDESDAEPGSDADEANAAKPKQRRSRANRACHPMRCS